LLRISKMAIGRPPARDPNRAYFVPVSKLDANAKSVQSKYKDAVAEFNLKLTHVAEMPDEQAAFLELHNDGSGFMLHFTSPSEEPEEYEVGPDELQSEGNGIYSIGFRSSLY